MKFRSFDSEMQEQLFGAPLGMIGPSRFCYKIGTNSESYLRDNLGIPADRMHATLPLAEAALSTLTAGKIFLTPQSHSLGAALTWDTDGNALIGMGPPGLFAMRTRIGMSTTFTPMITVSGSANYFKNLYTMHGTAAGDYTSWYITGHRNVFENVHFAGPMNAAQGGHASYIGVHVTGSENYFKNCVFGSKGIARDEVAPNLKIAGGDNVFENCWFVMQLSDTDPIFVLVDNTTTVNAWFKGCQFFAFSSSQASAAAVAFKVGAGDGTGQSADITLDPACSFHNVTKIAASATMKYFWMPTVFAATADELNLISIHSATY